MQNKEIFFPVFCQILLTFIVLCSLMMSRVRAIRRARVHPQVISDPTQFDDVMRGAEDISENLDNLSEMPILFYIAAIFIFSLQVTDSFYLIAGWAFVFFRCLHSLIHCTSNRVMARAGAFFLSCIALWAIWGRVGYQLFTR